MSDLSTWKPTSEGNNTGAPPDHAVENGTTIAELNNCMREDQAAVRRWYEDPAWRDYGDDGADIKRIDDTTFEVPGDQTALYYVGQRVKILNNGTKLATIESISIATGDTQITCELDGASVIDDNPTQIYAGTPKDGSEVGGLAGALAKADGVGNLITEGNVVSDTYTPLQEVPPDPDTSLNVPTMRGLEDALRTASGTFTPKLYTSDNITPDNIVYSTQEGSYYTIGDLVYVTIRITLTAAGDLNNSNNELLIGRTTAPPAGVDLDAYDPNGNDQSVGPVYEYSFKSGTADGVPDGGVCAWINNGASVIALKQPARDSSGTMISVIAQGVQSTTTIRFSGCYRRAPV